MDQELVSNNLLGMIGEIIILVLSIALVIITYYVKDHKPIKRVIEGKKDIYDILMKLKNNLKASRIEILYTENNGGIPRVRNALYSTVEYEVINEGVTPVSEAWKRRKVDRGYVNLMYEMIDKGYAEIVFEDLNPDGILKQYYKKLGTKRAFYLPITTVGRLPFKQRIKEILFPSNKFYYFAISFNEYRDSINAFERGRIYKDIKTIKELLGV